MHRKLIRLYSVCVLAIIIINNFYHHKSYLQYDRGHHCAAAILLASKVIECSQKFSHIISAYLKITQGEEIMITHEKIAKYRTPISQAEMNIIKVLDFDFNEIQPPYFILQELQVSNKNQNVYILCRLLLLDMAKCGAYLFYKPLEINVACIVLSHYFVTGELIPFKQKEEDIYEQKTMEIEENEKDQKFEYDSNLPPCFMLNLPSYNVEQLEQFFQQQKNQEDQEIFEETQKDLELKESLKSLTGKNIKLNRIYQIMDLLLMLYEKNKIQEIQIIQIQIQWVVELVQVIKFINLDNLFKNNNLKE